MKRIFVAGDIKEFKTIVKLQDVASFDGTLVHNVCSTFALARDIERTTRQFVVDMKEADEEGIGTYLEIEHKSPAFVGEEITFRGIFKSLTGNEINCSYEALVGSRLIASGRTGQKILTRDKIKSIFKHG